MKPKFNTLLFFFLFISSGVYAQVPVSAGGAGAPAGSGLNGANNKGLPATGLGCGGGGGSWWGGSGGAGKFGGGGGGAGGYFSLGAINWSGGDGGQGVVVVAYFNGASLASSLVLTSGTSVTVPSGVTSAKVWAIGGGGGGGGATANDGTAGGSGAAGGVAYITKSVTAGDIITYSIGSGGQPGHGALNGTAGGTTSATIAGTTINGNGGGAGLYNNTLNPSGGTYSGGDGGANGGSGAGRSGDVGGGGGGAIGTVNGTSAGIDGGTGASAADISGLFAACAVASNPVSPSITSFTPTAGLSGTVITVTGNGFTSASAVKIGGIDASTYSVLSDTEISATVSGSTVSGSVSVTCTNATVSLPIYLFMTPPVPSISSFSPVSAQTGTEITINGSNLLGLSSASFGGANALSVTVVSNYIAKAIVGDGASGSVSVTNSGGTASLAGFTWVSTTQASAVSFSNIQQSQMTISWTSGNAAKRVVFVKQGTGAISGLVNNTTYTASTDWSIKGSQAGSSGYYCIYNGTGNSVTLTGLNAATLYTIEVFEYNGLDGAQVYFTSTASNNPNQQLTLAILPLTWLDLSAEVKEGFVQVNWNTSNEVNTSFFTVEYSTDAVSWYAAGQLQSNGTIQGQSGYKFRHYTDIKGNICYRIRQTDIDGKFTYSKTVSVRKTGYAEFSLTENPVTNGYLKLNVNAPGVLKLMNSAGQLLQQKVTGEGFVEMDVRKYKPGFYIICFNNQSARILIL